MKNQKEWKHDATSREQNILPLDVARNEAIFFGKLLRWPAPMTPTQRIGAFIMGAVPLFCGVLALYSLAMNATKSEFAARDVSGGLSLFDVFAKIMSLFVALILTFCGAKVCQNAVSAPPQGRTKPQN